MKPQVIASKTDHVARRWTTLIGGGSTGTNWQPAAPRSPACAA